MLLPRGKTLDSRGYMEHYYIYANGGLHRDADAEERSQTRNLAATRDFKPTSPRRDRPAVCHRQLLRSQRCGPGQVRDAAPRAERGPFGDRRRDGFRFLASLVLPGTVRLRGRNAIVYLVIMPRPTTAPNASHQR